MPDILFTALQNIPASMTAMPPEHIRRRSQGINTDPQVFLNIGKQCSVDIEKALSLENKRWSDFASVLDFGCGCGRVLVWLADKEITWTLHGTDVDTEAIEWCNHNFPFAKWSANGGLPPIHYSENSFDLIYAIAVFTHLDETRQLEWLSELKRVTKTGGYVLLTVFGQHCAADLSQNMKDELKNKGICFMLRPEWKNIYPDWFGLAYHTEEYVRSTYSKYFKINQYLHRGLNNHLDLIVCEKS